MRLRSAAFALLLLLLALAFGTAHAAETGLFGTRELHSTNLAHFTKWDGVLARAATESEGDASCPGAVAGPACVSAWWRDFITTLAALPLRLRVERANDVLNRIPYVTAAANWHDPDHWETPYEFLAHGGQCQDYAIAKFLALEQSGVPDAALRLAIVHDRVTGADHAVAIVYLDGVPEVLDNQVPGIVAAAPGRYAPYYSINRTGWWLHQPAQPAAVQVARGTGDSVAH